MPLTLDPVDCHACVPPPDWVLHGGTVASLLAALLFAFLLFFFSLLLGDGCSCVSPLVSVKPDCTESSSVVLEFWGLALAMVLELVLPRKDGIESSSP